MYPQDSMTVMSLVVILTSLVVSGITASPVQAETGQGTDIFKVIMTIFGVDESKGDVIAIVTAKDEAARVKLFDALGPEVVPLNASEGGGHLIEYVATFPNLTINPGEGYKACISTVKNLELNCKTGNNSPASRPEFVDLSLNASGSDDDDIEQVVAADEEDSGNGEEEDNMNAAGEDSGLSPGIPNMG
ncbi:MAG TPA: hypothetical protein VJ225_03845 [Nitrososphaeraceae archaeon]|nr:hypothetical protein [Nitrososphaeraceae archaeon]